MIPQISRRNLLDNPDYSKLLLATKLHAAGEDRKAYELLKNIGDGCCLAQYVMGHCMRGEGLYLAAHHHLDESIKLLHDWEAHCCPFTLESEIICDKLLLQANAFRAKATVFRRQRDYEAAMGSFKQALEAAEAKLSVMASDAALPPRLQLASKDSIWADYEQRSAYRVVADVLFSYGYLLYERKTFDEAEPLFTRCIWALESANERWDAPYIRLGVIQVVTGKYEAAAQTFTQGGPFAISAETQTAKLLWVWLCVHWD